MNRIIADSEKSTTDGPCAFFLGRRNVFRLLILGCLVLSCSRGPADRNTESEGPLAAGRSDSIETQVRRFCGDCHAYPDPKTFAANQWPKEVSQGFRFYRESGRSDLEVPDVGEVARYYIDRAPETLEHAEVVTAPSKVLFERTDVDVPSGQEMPAVSFLLGDAAGDENGATGLLVCDMAGGRVHGATFVDRQANLTPLLQGRNPAHVEVCDLDADGALELLVADLGSFEPADHDQGQLLLGSKEGTESSREAEVLLDNVGRVADAEPADLDDDGDLDLVVAEFGWRATGQLRLLYQDETEGEAVTFSVQTLDPRHGASHVEVIDLNGDSLLDVIALISQEHEVVAAYLQRPENVWEQQVLFSPENPAYGFSGMQLVDLDGDGDEDLLCTNGDIFDAGILKPYHGVLWLENSGSFPFQAHQLAEMPGAYRAVPGDIDGDSDLDIAACAFFDQTDRDFSSLIWLEQVETGEFVRHELAGNKEQFCTLELADLDGDSRLDLAVGHFVIRPVPNPKWLSVWWNQGAQ